MGMLLCMPVMDKLSKPATRFRSIHCEPPTWGWNSRASGVRLLRLWVELSPMSSRAIVPIKISLTEGDFYTLWAPKWRQQGTEWQALLGDDESVLGFRTEAELLTFIESDKPHDLKDHPEWEGFNQGPANRSEEHTSELQSRGHLVCRLLLEKKNTSYTH